MLVQGALAGTEKDSGFFAALRMTQKTERNGVFDISRFPSLGAGVTPAEGSVKPTAGFTYNEVSFAPLRFGGCLYSSGWLC